MSYVKISDLRRKSRHRLELPVTIGSSRLCDIIVNAGNVPPLSLVLDGGPDGALALTDVPRSLPASLDRLTALGLAVIGPIKGKVQDGGASTPAQRLAELAATERSVFQRLPLLAQAALGGFFPQKIRLGLWLALPVAAMVAAAIASNQKPAEPDDLAKKKLPLTPGSVLTDSVGAVKGYPAFRNGFSFRFEPNEALAAGGEAVLYFDAKDLDEKAELRVSVNGRELWASAASPECINVFCKTSIDIPAGLIVAGENVIAAAHTPSGSTYLLKNMLLNAAGKPTPERRAEIDMVYTRAKRAFDERAIVLQNLVTAKDELDRLDRLLIGAKGEDQVRNDAALLRKAADEALDKVSGDLSFNAERAIQLGRYEQAEKQYKELLTLHPQADDKVRLAIQKRLREIKEMAK